MSADPAEDPAASGGGSFPTTQWSMVLHAGVASSSQARDALEALCVRYWYPLYAFVRRQGRAHHEAEDCTQEFLARLLANDGITRARPERGRFRTFLLTALRNFLIDEWQSAQAAKRGGGQTLLSFDFSTAEERFTNEPMDPGLTPEQAFDRSWALGMVDRAIAELRQEYEKSGRGAVYRELGPLVWGDTTAESVTQQAARAGLNPHAFTVALHRLRRRLGERLRAAVAETVAEGADIDAELRHLIAAIPTRNA